MKNELVQVKRERCDSSIKSDLCFFFSPRGRVSYLCIRVSMVGQSNAVSKAKGYR